MTASRLKSESESQRAQRDGENTERVVVRHFSRGFGDILCRAFSALGIDGTVSYACIAPASKLAGPIPT